MLQKAFQLLAPSKVSICRGEESGRAESEQPALYGPGTRRKRPLFGSPLLHSSLINLKTDSPFDSQTRQLDVSVDKSLRLATVTTVENEKKTPNVCVLGWKMLNPTTWNNHNVQARKSSRLCGMWNVCAACLFKPCSKQNSGERMESRFFQANIRNYTRAEESWLLSVLSAASERLRAPRYFEYNWSELKRSQTPSIDAAGLALPSWTLRNHTPTSNFKLNP